MQDITSKTFKTTWIRDPQGKDPISTKVNNIEEKGKRTKET